MINHHDANGATMKNRTKVALLLVALVFGVVVWLVVWPYWAWRRDYGEAEPLVQVIWPMAGEMRRFSDERGEPPNNLEEIARFASYLDLSALRYYPHEFSTTGSRRFFLRVNSRFAFVIDEQFKPDWFQPTNVGAAPTNPK